MGSPNGETQAANGTVNDQKAGLRASSPTIVRPLGHFERYMEADYYWDYVRGNSVTCRFVLPEELADPARYHEVKEQFLRALARTSLDHPMLQAVLVDECKKSPSFARLSSVNLDNLVDWRMIEATEDYNAATDKIIHENADTPLNQPQSLPGWRIIVTRSETLPFFDAHMIVRHTMIDGESRKIFYRSLLDHLNNPPENDDQTKTFVHGHTLKLPGKGVDFPPPMEKYGEFILKLGFLASVAWKELKPSFMQHPTATQKSWGPYKTGDYRTKRETIRIDNAKTQKIIEACRAKQTTVTGLIHGIAFASIHASCGEKVKSQAYESSTAVNLRRFMPNKPHAMPDVEMDPNNTIMNMLTVITHNYDEAEVRKLEQLIQPVSESGSNNGNRQNYEKLVWAVAKSVRGGIQKKLDKGLKNDVMDTMRFVPDWRAEKKRAGHKARIESWQVTNIGVFDGNPPPRSEKSGKWRVSHAVFTPSVDVSRSLFMMSAISVKGGDMCITIACQQGVNEYIDKVAAQLTRDMHSWCNYIATSEWSDDWAQRPYA